MESTKQVNIQEIFENEIVKIWMDNEIVFFTYKKDAVTTLEDAIKFNECRNEACKGVPKLHLADCREVKYWTQEARIYSNSEEATRCISAIALIIKSDIQRTIWNWAVKFLKIKTPAKLFSIKNKEGCYSMVGKE